MDKRVIARSQYYGIKRARQGFAPNTIPHTYSSNYSDGCHIRGCHSLPGGLASLDSPIQTSWGSLDRTGPEMRWK